MMALWMGYAVLLGVLLGLAARLGEWLLRTRGAPGRWSWAVAMGASLALPAWALVAPSTPAADPVVSGGSSLSPALLVQLGSFLTEAAPTPLAYLDPYLEAAWITASLLLLLWLAGGLLRLARRARQWPPAHLSDQQVLVSRDFGPALLGILRPRVILPRWSLEMDDRSLEMIVLHEWEHARAGDGILLLLGASAVVAAPWNPALWWQLRRLRGALEVDCDERVLACGVARERYGRLLLELGSRGENQTLAVAGLARPDSLLERRLTMMVHGVNQGSPARRLAAGALGLALVVVACETPPPTSAPADVADAQVAGTVSPAPLSALDGEASPMIFVDGVQVQDIPELAPDDIDRVEVLKGETSRDRYGDGAEHGVIRIRTKEGADGPAGRSPLGEVSLDERPDIYLDGTLYRGDPDQIDPDGIDRIEVHKNPDGSPSSIHIYRKG